MSWDNVCKTKGEGGLAIRRFDDVMKAVAIKLFWRCLQGEVSGQDGCTINIVKQKLLTVTVDNNASYTWKTLLKVRQWCKGKIDRKIINGEDTDMWYDPWISGSSPVDKLGWQYITMIGGPNIKVSFLVFGNEQNGSSTVCLPIFAKLSCY